MALAVAEGQSLSGVGTIPLIVDLDAHVVEPPDVWSSRLPARMRRCRPRVPVPARESVCTTRW